MTRAKHGDRVKIHYKGYRQDGSIFGSTKRDQPAEAILGSGRLVPGLEESILGMETGETKSITVPPERGYGRWVTGLIVNISRNNFPDDIVPIVGKPVLVWQDDHRCTAAIIRRVTEEVVTLDVNHPLAGETLTFDIQLIELVPNT